jgi:ferritin-like metal-binding protein YciE
MINLNYNKTSLKTQGSEPLENLLMEELKDIYGGEKILLRTLVKMHNSASEVNLRLIFERHSHTTFNQVVRLEEIFEMLGRKPESIKSNVIEGLVEEAEIVLERMEMNDVVKDLALILIAQKIEHYEMAAYGGLALLARTLDFEKVARLLEISLQEETKTDCLLTDIVVNHISYRRSQPLDKIWF